MMSVKHFCNSGKENYKILKPVCDVITNYLAILLVTLSVVVAGMEITSAKVECLPVVDCPSAAKSSLDVFMSNAHLKFPDVCTNFYRSQKTSFIERT